MKYLYNGIECIALPKWDKEKYPCVVLSGIEPQTPSDSRPLTMYAFPEVKYGDSVFGGRYIKCEPNGNYFTAYVYEDEWQVTEPDDSDLVTHFMLSGTDNVFWTNVDLHNEDGTLYLAASKAVNAETGEEIDYSPIPVTAPQLDPLSLWLGYQAGQWVARQRGKA